MNRSLEMGTLVPRAASMSETSAISSGSATGRGLRMPATSPYMIVGPPMPSPSATTPARNSPGARSIPRQAYRISAVTMARRSTSENLDEVMRVNTGFGNPGSGQTRAQEEVPAARARPTPQGKRSRASFGLASKRELERELEPETVAIPRLETSLRILSPLLHTMDKPARDGRERNDSGPLRT